MKKKNICIIFIILIALGLFGCVPSDDVSGVVVDVVDDGQFFEVEDKVEENTDYEHEEDILETDENIDYTEVEEVDDFVEEEEEEENFPIPIDINDIYLASIPITRLLEEPFVDIFGYPMSLGRSDCGPVDYLHYEGFTFFASGDWIPMDDDGIMLERPSRLLMDSNNHIFLYARGLSLLSIGNHVFNQETNIEDIRAMLGDPVQHFLDNDWIINSPSWGRRLMCYPVSFNDEVKFTLCFETFWYDSIDDIVKSEYIEFIILYLDIQPKLEQLLH